MLTVRGAATSGLLIGLAVLALTTGSLVAQEPTVVPAGTATPDHMGMMGQATPGVAGTPAAGDPHEMMHAMMDAMHGPGTSERMHEAMGPDGERLMEQCAAMMQMMGMMMDGGMAGMMGGRGMEGMAGMPTPTATPRP